MIEHPHSDPAEESMDSDSHEDLPLGDRSGG